jgi:hypothetical protein
LWVGVAAFGGVVVAGDDDVVVVVDQVPPLLVGVCRLQELIWLMGVPMRVLQPSVPASFLELLLVVGCPGMICP